MVQGRQDGTQAMIDSDKIQLFTRVFAGYLASSLGETGLEMGQVKRCDPSDAPVSDLTGIIGISGENKGCIYITAQEGLIRQVLEEMGETDIDTGLLTDMCGEIANTLAGNVMSACGADFELTVPVVIRGKPDNIYLPRNASACVISARWKNLIANLVVCIE